MSLYDMHACIILIKAYKVHGMYIIDLDCSYTFNRMYMCIRWSGFRRVCAIHVI